MPDAAARNSLLDEIVCHLEQEGATEARLAAVLDKILSHFDCAVGSIHSLDSASGELLLRAHRGIPEAVLSRIRSIAIGKGMAGLAAARRQPVQVCNLQTDGSGAANAKAKETNMEGAIAVPMLVAESLRGVLGIAKPVAYEFSAPEIAVLTEVSNALGSFLGAKAEGPTVGH